MHTVVETLGYLRDAQAIGLGELERFELISRLAENPTAGDLMAGTGGYRKVRVARPGQGRSGGHRVVTVLVRDGRVFLLAAFAKSRQANLTQAERNALPWVTSRLSEED
jgi:hypothetical protein